MDMGPYIRVCYFGSLKGVQVSSGTVQWYRSGCGTDFDNSETASPVHPTQLRLMKLRLEVR